MWLESRVKKSDFEHLKECFCFECDIKTSTPLRRNSKLGTVPWKDLKAASALMANGASQALAVCILCSLQLGWILSRKAWVTLIRPGQIWNRRPNWRFLRSDISESKSIWRNDFSIIFWIGLVHSKLSLKLTRTWLSSCFRVQYQDVLDSWCDSSLGGFQHWSCQHCGEQLLTPVSLQCAAGNVWGWIRPETNGGMSTNWPTGGIWRPSGSESCSTPEEVRTLWYLSCTGPAWFGRPGC